eukprot:gene9961-7837_t
MGKNKVAYFYDSEFQECYFGQNHPMKPHRLAMTHHLVLGYGLHNQMDVFRPRKAYPCELAQFHSEDYVEFLSRITPENVGRYTNQLRMHNINEDCPVFCKIYVGASIEISVKLNHGQCDIAINWLEDCIMPLPLSPSAPSLPPSPCYPHRFCQLYAGAFIKGAVKLNHGLCDIAINWAGKLHRATATFSLRAPPPPSLLPSPCYPHRFCQLYAGAFIKGAVKLNHGLFCQLYAGASIEGAVKLNHGLCDIAINWAGGLHHAKKSEASGFCYVNDLVLGILELLKYHARVLYVDIDVHHGDGVEEAFYMTDRVMTSSTAPLTVLFPSAICKHYAVNVPLKDGTTDETFHALFKPIMRKIMEMFQPGAIVMQCGADSLAHDRLGCFNMSLKGHGDAIRFMKEYGIPMLVTGGGGYTKHNVVRCWAYETSILTDTPVPEL